MPKATEELSWWLRDKKIHLPIQETWVQSLSGEDPLEKETAAHSSILAWRIPQTEEPGGLQSTGFARVGQGSTTTKGHRDCMLFLIIIFEFLLIYWLHLTACGILVPRPGIKSMAPGVEALSLSHWSTREVPESRALKQLILCYVVFTSILKKISQSYQGRKNTSASRSSARRGQIRPQAVSRPAPPSFPRLPLSHQLCRLTPSLCPPPGSPRDARNLPSHLSRVLLAFEA